MKRKLACLVLAAIMIMGSSLTVYAEDMKGADDWEVVFDGKDVESNFSSANIDDAVYAIQPGDTMEMWVTIRNKSDIDTDWYMTNKVLKTLEEADEKGQNLPTGGAYEYLLTYTDPAGTVTTLYKSETLGGDSTEGGVGLLGATNSLDEFFFLDRLSPNQSGVVTLKVTLEGETQGNDYQNTLARVQMNFAVERATVFSEPGTITPETPTSPNRDPEVIEEVVVIENEIHKESSSTVGFTSPKTGDEVDFLYPALALIAGLVLLVAGIVKSRREPEEESEG